MAGKVCFSKPERLDFGISHYLCIRFRKMMNYDTPGRPDDAFQCHQYEIT